LVSRAPPPTGDVAISSEDESAEKETGMAFDDDSA